MTQYSRPASDLALNGWSNPSWSVIDEGCASYDGTFASSPTKTSATLQCSLSSVTDPSVSSGYGLRVRGYVQSNGVATINITLYCGGTLIKTWTPSWTTSSAEYSTSLTTGEADAITNHADMRVWFEFVYTSGSQGRGYIDAFDFEVPDAPITGTASITLADLGKTLTGTVDIVGSASNTLSSISISSTGVLDVAGSLSKSLESLTISAVGTVENSFYYEIQRHDGDGIWDPVGSPTFDPYYDSNNLVDGTTYTYRVRLVNGGVPGNWSNEASVTFRGELHGVASITLGTLAFQGIGTAEIKSAANITLESIIVASTGKLDIAGTGSSNLGSIGLAATAVSEIKATASTTLSSLAITASGKLDSIGNFDKSLSDIAVSATSQVEVKSNLSIGLGSVSLSGELFNIRMESDLSEWPYLLVNGGQISWSADAALNGSSGGMLVSVDSTTAVYGQYTSGQLQQFLLKFYFDPNSLVMGNGNAFNLVTLRQSTGSFLPFYYLETYYATSTGYRVRHHALRDDGTDASNDYVNITDAPHCIEILITSSSSDLASDGSAQWWVDGVEQGLVTGIDNYNRMQDQKWQWRFGATANVDAETSGIFYIDEVSATDYRAATGKVEIKGVASVSLDGINVNSAGTVDAVGSLTKSLSDIVLETAGFVGYAPIEGVVATTLASMSLSSTGVVPILGTLSKSLDALTSSLIAGAEAKGVASQTLGDITTSLAGAAEAKGSLSLTLGNLTGASSAISSISGSLGATLDAIGTISSGVVTIVGTLSKSLDDIGFSITAALSSVGATTSNLEPITASVTGAVLAVGTYDYSLATIGVSTEGYVYSLAIIPPITDQNQGTWTASTGTDLYECVNESSPSDLDFMQSEINPTYSPVVVALGEAPDLGLSVGHTLSYRIGQNGSGSLQLLVELRENYVNESSQGSLIASWQHVLGEMTTYDSPLTENQINSIVDYSSLFVRMVAEV